MSDRLFPALSFDGLHVASGDTDVVRDGVPIAADGCWPTFQGDTIYYKLHSAEGLMRWTSAGGVSRVEGPLSVGGDVIGVAINGTALAISRTDAPGPRIIFADGSVLPGVTSPTYDDTGKHFACLSAQDDGLLLDGKPLLLHGKPVTGASNLRFGGTTFMCEIPWGRVLGIADCDNPDLVANPIVFSAGVPLYKPHPVWNATVGVLGYSCHTNDALLFVLWGTSKGWVIARGTLDEGYHDARPLGTGVRVVWSAAGILGDYTQSLRDSPLMDVFAAVSPLIPPPVSQPLPDIPWTPAPVGTPFDVEHLFVGSATAVQTAPDGSRVLWYRKSDPVGPDAWGAWLDVDAQGHVGLLCDTSNGDIMPGGTGIDFDYFDGPHLWAVLRGTSPWSATYQTTLRYRDGRSQPLTVTVGLEAGYGRFNGVEVFYRHTYDPGTPEHDYYTRDRGVRWERAGRVVQPTPYYPHEAFAPLPPIHINPIAPASVPAPRPTPTPNPAPKPTTIPSPAKGPDVLFTSRDILDNPKLPWNRGTYVGNTIQIPDDQTLVLDHGDRASALIFRALNAGEPGGGVVSLQPDGYWQLRTVGTNGPYETHTKGPGATVTYFVGGAKVVLGVADGDPV